MQVFFRADASTELGIGHVMRCLTLADQLHNLGAQCHFICAELPGHAASRIISRGFSVHLIEAQNGNIDAKTDALACQKILSAEQAAWLVVDHYALSIDWQHRLRPFCRRLGVIDDLANRQHDCDLLIDPNWFGEQTSARYQQYVPANSLQLLGPAYALLRPEYATLRAQLPERSAVIRRVLVTMGGSDPTNEITKVLQAMSVPELQPLALDIVCGQQHPALPLLQLLAAQRGGVTLFESLPSLAGLMMRADLMICAGGSTNWERLCLGLPALVISTAENQQAMNQALAADGLCFYAGKAEHVNTDGLIQALCSILQDQEHYLQQSHAAFACVDGKGAAKVAAAMMALLKNRIDDGNTQHSGSLADN